MKFGAGNHQAAAYGLLAVAADAIFLTRGTPTVPTANGTTLRVFHPESEAWRAVWLNPLKGKRNDLIGRRIGDDIVQLCLGTDRPEKWVFSQITARSFLWRAYLLGDDGLTWVMGTEVPTSPYRLM